MKKILLAIVGPTASGKSALAARIARELPSALISCDSVQVYRGFDKGTSKPSPEERAAMKHYLVDIIDAHEEFHAGRFVSLADEAINTVSAEGRLPLIVGGTGLYLRALLHGLSPAPDIPQTVRDQLEEDRIELGMEALYGELETVDPDWASRLPPTDTQRILRGLAVYRGTGKRLSEFNKEHQFTPRRYRCRTLALDVPREELYKRINSRVLEMMEDGLFEEVKQLLEKGIPVGSKPMQTPGYKELAQVISGNLSLEEAISKTQQAHRRYAKRQMTWFRSTDGVEWVSPKDSKLPQQIATWYSEEKGK